MVPTDQIIPRRLIEYGVTQRNDSHQLVVTSVPHQKAHPSPVAMRHGHLPVKRRQSKEVGLPSLSGHKFEFRFDCPGIYARAVRKPLAEFVLMLGQPDEIRGELLFPLTTVKLSICFLIKARG